MSAIEAKLKEAGYELPPTPQPVASYVAAKKTGNLVFTAGQLPKKEGALVIEGIVDRDVSLKEAQDAAQLCTLNALAAAKSVIGDLDKITQVVKLTIFVASTQEFTGQPQVGNGASEFLQEIFGEKGQHARSAVASPSLPANTPVEVEAIFEVKE